MKRYLITSALPYANGYLHLGHLAGAYVPADIYSRFLRLTGESIIYICGSDEHGVAITIAADKENVSPKDIIDKYHSANKDAFEKFGMSFDIYSRTSDPVHHETAREFFESLLKKDYLTEKEENQFYDEEAKMFLPDRYVEGICPNCGNEKARGDQCESCGAYYDQLKLGNPISLISGKTPTVRKTTHWYMRFDLFQTALEHYIESHAGDWKENVLQQSRSWLKQGLMERAITRDLNWGVSIENLGGIPDSSAAGKVLYVWFEAVLGYISATKILFSGKDASHNWKTWWQTPETDYIAFIGKDNIVFHTLIFPAILIARHDNYIVPKNVPANEFLNLEGQKFSKSRNWSIDLLDFQKNFPEPFYMDALRYTLVMNLPETRDSDFTWKDFQARNNNELADIFGNFVNRTFQFLQRFYELAVPVLPLEYKHILNDWEEIVNRCNNEIEFSEKDFPELTPNDYALITALAKGINKITHCYKIFRFRDAVTETMNIARAANKYFNDEEPWATKKSKHNQSDKTIYVCMQIVRSLAILFQPVIPFTSRKIFEILSIPIVSSDATAGESKYNFFADAALPWLTDRKLISIPSILFPKIDDFIIDSQIEKLGVKTDETEAKKPVVTYEEFSKVKLRTGKIISAEKIPKSKKLLKLIVDIGNTKRQVVAGIGEKYLPEDLVDKVVVVVTNLKTTKIMGVESQGMVLAAGDGDTLSVIVPDDIGFEQGWEVK